MNQYKIVVTFSALDTNNNTVNRKMPFVVSANSLEEARSLVQEEAAKYVSKVNGTILTVE